MADERYQIAYEEALRSISDQQTALTAIQNRVSTVASAAGVTTALLGLRTDAGDVTGFVVVALIALLGIIVLSGAVIWPRQTWRFHFRASELHWNYIEGAQSLNADLMKRDLALYLDAYFTANTRYINRFGRWLSLAIVLLLIDVTAVILEIWRG